MLHKYVECSFEMHVRRDFSHPKGRDWHIFNVIQSSAAQSLME